ncbi:MAG: cytochrome c biogenesis protein ResB, partial [Muribaculaceae bacterium]
MVAFILLAIMCVCLAVISCLPSHAEAYTSLPMVALWGAIVIVALIYIFSRKRRLKGALLMLHLSFVVILCGAFVTWLWGSTDSLHLRVGEPIEYQGHSINLLDFSIDYYPGTRAPRDYVSTIQVDEGEQKTVSMNNILNINGMRLYQSAYDPDMNGTVLNVNHDPWGVGIT